ncbi:DoxX family protein [Thalassoglobus polymorphus]|nr:DoxX family protein [Thalassoglobus polymorphus]
MMNRDTTLSAGLLILRVAIGGFMLVHGYQKLVGFSGLATKFPDPLGIGSQMSLVATIGAEVGCSLLLILGLGTRLAALPLAFTMIIALFVIHGADPWQRKELAAIFLSVYAAIVLTGPGRFSLDHSLWGKKSSPARSGKTKA